MSRKPLLGWAALAFVGLSVGGGVASADRPSTDAPGGAAPGSAKPSAAAAAPALPPDPGRRTPSDPPAAGALPVRASAPLVDAATAAEAQKAARSVHGALVVDASAVQGDLRAARSGKKTVRAACLDLVLTQLHVTTREARDRADALGDGALTKEALTRELSKLGVLRERGKSLVLQARRCVDPAAASPNGGTEVRVRAVPDLPEPPLPAPERRP